LHSETIMAGLVPAIFVSDTGREERGYRGTCAKTRFVL
jgi:hypothetical protein